MSKREELRMRRQQQARRRQLGLIAGTVVLAIAVVGFLIYQNSRPVGELVMIEKEPLPYPDGKALGPAGAPVTVQEFSDFQ